MNNANIDNITELIIGSAYKVYNKLGFGFIESVYEKALVIEVGKNDIELKSQVPIKVFYDDKEVGEFRADLLFENRLIVELKAVRTLAKEHEIQLVNYLTATKIDIGLLINFGENGFEIKRKYRHYRCSNMK